MTEGLVSVITPCYNDEKYIAETIESVRSQTYTNWEMLIIDDGSTDGSAQVIREHAGNDARIKYFRQENAGSSSARNNGIRRAEGQYIALLDADDIWLPDFLKKQVSFLKASGGVCAACSYEHIDRRSRRIRGIIPVKKVITMNDMRVRDHIGCLTGLYDCSRYGKIFLPEEMKSLRDDYAYWVDIVRLEGKCYGNREVLARHRLRPGSVSGDKIKMAGLQYRFYRDYLNEPVPEAAINLIRWAAAGIIKYRQYSFMK